MNFRKFSIAGAVVGLSLLVGCWIPEEFNATIQVNSDGSYTFTYDGTLTYALALAAAQQDSLSREDEAALAKAVEDIREDPDVKKVTYAGKGRYKVLVERRGRPGEQYYFLSKELNIFSVKPQQDGSIAIAAERFSEKDLAELKAIGAKVEGTLTVSLARGVAVLRHNAQREPKLLGLIGSYEWDIRTVDADPLIVVRHSSGHDEPVRKTWGS